jgi:hypothetical protein
MAGLHFLKELDNVILALGTHYIGTKPKVLPADKHKVKNEADAFAKWVVRRLNELFRRTDGVIL